MPKPRRLRRNLAPREDAPLPAERVAAQPFVVADGRIIAPWATHNAMTSEDQRRLLCVLDYVNAAPPDCPCWIWPERSEPVPIECDGDLRSWLARWATGKAVYVARRARP